MIIIRNCIKHYGSRKVLAIESLAFEREKMYMLVGHNGAGKTTLLRILAGLEVPDSGTVTVDFNPGDIVLCMQNPYMFIGSVKENLLYGLKARNMPTSSEHIDYMIERFKLGPILNKNAKALSTGETQRTSLARSLLCKPKLLLLDEPTANVDPECVADVEDEIMRQNASGVTIIIATHITGLAYRIPSEIIRLERGQPAHPELNNVFAGELVHKGRQCFVTLAPSVQFACVTDKFGDVRIAIPAVDVVLSQQHIDSSMRNQFEGTVKEIRQLEDFVEVDIDIGVVIKAAITPASLKEMKLEPGAKIFVSFKATAVKVF